MSRFTRTLALGAAALVLGALPPGGGAAASTVKQTCTDQGFNDVSVSDAGYYMNAVPSRVTELPGTWWCISSDAPAGALDDASALYPNLRIDSGNIAWPGGAPTGFPRIGTADTENGVPPSNRGLPVALPQMKSVYSTFRTSGPAVKHYNIAYDLWFGPDCATDHNTDPYQTEIMVWSRGPDGVGLPSGNATWARYDDVTIDGVQYRRTSDRHLTGTPTPVRKYTVYYERVTPVDSVENLDLAKIARDAQFLAAKPNPGQPAPPAGQTLLQGDWKFCKAEAGFELFGQSAGAKIDAFTVHAVPYDAPEAFVTSGVSGQCLDAQSGATAENTPVTAYRCNHTAAQKWAYADNELSYQGACVTSQGNRSTADNPVVLAPCAGGAGQKWLVDGQRLKNPASGRCLATPASGNQLVLAACGTAAGQKWRAPAWGTPTGPVKNGTGTAERCADYDQWTGDFKVRGYTCNASAAQRWKLNANDTITLADPGVGSGRCLTNVNGRSYHLPCALNAAGQPTDGRQIWLPTPGGGLVNAGHDAAQPTVPCLADPSPKVDTVPFQVTACTGSAAQTWVLPT